MFRKKTVKIDIYKFPIVKEILNDLHINDGRAVFDYRGKKEKWIKASSKIGRISKKIGIEYLYPPSTNRINQLGFVMIPKNIKVDKQICNDKIIRFDFIPKQF